MYSWFLLSKMLQVWWRWSEKSCFCPLPASPYCPMDGVYHAESSRCFQIFPVELSWTDARQQCSERGGDLAVVRSDELRDLLAHKVTQWVFLSDWGAEMEPHSFSTHTNIYILNWGFFLDIFFMYCCALSTQSYYTGSGAQALQKVVSNSTNNLSALRYNASFLFAWQH